MSEVIGRCGFKCHLCPVYTPNIKSEGDRIEISCKWKQFYQYEIKPESIRCDGCSQSLQIEGDLLHSDCEFKICAENRGLSVCNNCKDYPCNPLEQYYEGYRELAKEFRGTVSEEDYRRYFEPYLLNE